MEAKIAILTIGTELTTGLEADINSYFLSKELFSHGFIVSTHMSVADKAEDIEMAIKQFIENYQVIIITGGIGPTEDDLTREAVSRAVNKKLHIDEGIYNILISRTERKFAKKMASFPEGSNVIIPPNGVVGGFYLDYMETFIVSLPGVPQEAESIFRVTVLPEITKRFQKPYHFRRKNYKIADLTEVEIEKKLSLIKDKFNYGLLPKYREVHLYITVNEKTQEKADGLLDLIDAQINEIFFSSIFGHTDENLEDYIVSQLLVKKLTCSVAESSTGGMLGAIITSVSGSSNAFLGGFIVYSNKMKEQLGVNGELLAKHGAVSREVAVSMAKCANAKSSSNYALSITGIAGPEGASFEEPVGLHYIAVTSDNGQTIAERFIFKGDRSQIRFQATKSALLLIRKMLMEESTP